MILVRVLTITSIFPSVYVTLKNEADKTSSLPVKVCVIKNEIWSYLIGLHCFVQEKKTTKKYVNIFLVKKKIYLYVCKLSLTKFEGWIFLNNASSSSLKNCFWIGSSICLCFQLGSMVLFFFVLVYTSLRLFSEECVKSWWLRCLKNVENETLYRGYITHIS